MNSMIAASISYGKRISSHGTWRHSDVGATSKADRPLTIDHHSPLPSAIHISQGARGLSRILVASTLHLTAIGAATASSWRTPDPDVIHCAAKGKAPTMDLHIH